MKGKTIGLLVVIIIILVVIYLALQTTPEVNDQNGLPMMEEFLTKIVYTTDIELAATAFKADCGLRDGTFDECGTVCEPEAEFCTQVCAYTCDLSDVESSAE